VQKKATIALRKLYEDAEGNSYLAIPSENLRNNIKQIGRLVGLSDVDQRILEFVAVLHTNRTLDYVSNDIGVANLPKLAAMLAVILDIPEVKTRLALNHNSPLSRSGLLTLESFVLRTMPLKMRFRLLSDTFAEKLLEDNLSPMQLIRDRVRPAGLAQLRLVDYGHIIPTLDLLFPYLDHALQNRQIGVNILVYGPPGTGKSELAKVLAQELGSNLFEVASEDESDKPIDGERRFQAYKTAQAFFKQERTLIVFDEVEDVFASGSEFFGMKSVAQKNKAWVNRTLEENPVPAIWVTNAINCIDPAFIRRFDLVFELPIPARRQREKILQQASHNLLSDEFAASIAQTEFLAPAVVTRVASVVNVIDGKLGFVDSKATEKAFELLINNTLIAQGHGAIKKNNPNALPGVYDPAFIHANSDLSLIASGLAKSKSGRLCLYGPPGTGKTAFACWLAEQMDIPLIIKRASDILGMYVGQNEKNIARAFYEAEQEGAILLIDEVDSFLQDRRGASKSWEVTSVNEMLTQMESFSGIFIASTNLMGEIDQAAQRRFDLKVKFDFLLTRQACDLLKRYCQLFAIPSPSAAELEGFAEVVNVTPGDFAAVMRQHRFSPINSAGAMINAVMAECALKEGAISKRSVGFL
jgi:SpoVK/Ycf46/Vps4 family AAA+-type ATPase